MAKRQSVSTLPSDVLSQLHQRLVNSNFGEYSEHSVWLHSLGFSISKSSIHRYSCDHEDQIRLSASPCNNSSADIRMRCLELASWMIDSNDNVMLFKKADELLNWVLVR